MFAFDVGFPSWGYQVGLRCGFCIWGLRARFQAGAFQCGCSFIYFLSGRACGVVTMVMTRWFFVLRFFQVLLFPGCPRGAVIMAMARWSLQRLFKMFSILFFFVGLLTRGSVHGYGAMVFAVFLSWASAKTFAETPTGFLQKLHESGSPDWCDGFGPVVIAV